MSAGTDEALAAIAALDTELRGGTVPAATMRDLALLAVRITRAILDIEGATTDEEGDAACERFDRESDAVADEVASVALARTRAAE